MQDLDVERLLDMVFSLTKITEFRITKGLSL